MKEYIVTVTRYGKKEISKFKTVKQAIKFASEQDPLAGVLVQWVKENGDFGVTYRRPEERHSDILIRHKWPEEKPEEEKPYLTRIEIDGVVSYVEIYWSEQLSWHSQHGKYITHWWKLPEVTE